MKKTQKPFECYLSDLIYYKIRYVQIYVLVNGECVICGHV